MKKKVLYTLSFTEGMVEVRKPDGEQDQEQPQTSVIWLENYDPNIQMESLVMRTGYQVEGTSGKDNINVTNTANTSNYVGSIDVDLGGSYRYQDSVLLGATSFVVSEPAFCDGIVAFVHKKIDAPATNNYPARFTETEARKLHTTVISYLPHYKQTGFYELNLKWDCSEVMAAGLRGYVNVPGYLSDYGIYGESIVFTTLSPITSDSKLNTMPSVSDESPRRRYPVYQYKYVNLLDYYRDDNVFMRGIAEYDKTTIEANRHLYSRWIVKTPSGVILQSNVGAYTTIGNTPVKLNVDGTVGSGNLTDDIALIVWERDIQELNYEYRTEDFVIPKRQKETEEFAAPGEYLEAIDADAFLPPSISAVNLPDNWNVSEVTNPFLELKITKTGKPSQYYNCLEALNLKSLYDLAKSKPLGYPLNYIDRKVYTSDTVQAIQGSNVNVSDLGIVAGNVYAVDQYNDVDYRFSKIVLFENQEVIDAPSGNTYNIDNIAFVDYYSSHFSTGGPERPADPKISECLYDYLALKIPRLWIPTEKINFLLVATINGIKIPIGEFNYIVRANDLNEYVGSIKAQYDLTPSVYDPTLWTEPDPLNPKTIANLNGTKEMSSYSLYSVSKDATGTDLPSTPVTFNYRSSWFQMWASMVPSSINSNNGFFSGNQADEPSTLTSDILKFGNVNTLYPLEHYTQRYLHQYTTGRSQHSFKIVKLTPTSVDVVTSANGGWQDITTTQVRVGKIVSVTIALKKDMIDGFMQNGLTEISVYAVQPSTSEHIINSTGLHTINEPDGIVYSKPKSITTKNDFSKYALVKTFSLVSKNQEIESYKDIGATRITSNAWHDYTAGSTDYCMAVPVQEGSTDPYADIPPFDTVSSVELGNKSKTWTPDFYLWDYPTEQPLVLNYSGETWDGVGARCIAVVKGRTFIGGTYSEKGIEEQAIVRYSIAQGGVISPDLFAKEDQLRIGHEPITALVEFREQLWVFNKTRHYRIQMRDIFDVTSWEFLEAVVQGVHHPKHIAQTPYGLVWCNEGGVWLSDGADPQNLAVPVIGLYSYVARGYVQPGANLYFFNKDGIPYETFRDYDTTVRHIEGNLGEKMNKYIECVYDALNDELYIYFPLFLTVDNVNQDAHSALVFSFKFRNWRTERIETGVYDDES